MATILLLNRQKQYKNFNKCFQKTTEKGLTIIRICEVSVVVF